MPAGSSGDIPGRSRVPVQGNILSFTAKRRPQTIVHTALPSQPPGDPHRDAQSSSSCEGGFSAIPDSVSKVPVTNITGLSRLLFSLEIFFTPCLELNLVLEPSPTYICKAGNSLLPPTRTILVSPGQALALRIDDLGEIPTFIYFAIDSCLLREALRCHPRE